MISGIAAGILLVLALLLWLVSVGIRNVSIIDIFWGPGFAIVAWVIAAQRGLTLSGGQWLLLVLVSVWALRLGAYLAWRNLGKGEDYRYAAMRSRIGPRFWWVSLLSVFGLQGALIFVISLPVQAALLCAVPGALGPLGALGLSLWSIGLAFEAIGDAQLARFKADPASAGKVMDQGLWRFTRHPNYFGDFMIWWGLFGLSWSLGAPWWSVVSPLLMSYLLTRVSGVPMLEAAMTHRRVGYDEYVRRTSAFFPRRPKR
jgi:steroid 5-alpha reductase family enzyme